MRKEAFEKRTRKPKLLGRNSKTVNKSQHRKEVERIKGNCLLFWIIITMPG